MYVIDITSLLFKKNKKIFPGIVDKYNKSKG